MVDSSRLTFRTWFSSWSQDHWQTVIASLAIILSVASIVFSAVQQTRAIRAARDDQMLSIKAERRNALIALFSTIIGNINLETTAGRAAYLLALETARELDEQEVGHGFRYIDMLPRFDPANLTFWFSDQPGVLPLVARIGPRTTVPANPKDQYFVTVAFFRTASDEAVEHEKEKLLSKVADFAKTSAYSVKVVWNRELQARAIVIGGQRSWVYAREIKNELLTRGISGGPVLISAMLIEPYIGQKPRIAPKTVDRSAAASPISGSPAFDDASEPIATPTPFDDAIKAKSARTTRRS